MRDHDSNTGSSASAAREVPSDAPRPGEVFPGRYRVERYLGVGSLCSTYLCRDLEEGGSERVLKILLSRKASQPQIVEGFLFLARQVSRYRHPGIIRIYDSGVHGGAPFYVEDFLPGRPLRMWLLEKLGFDERVAPGLDLVRRLADTLGAIHQQGCYGCLKPENVFLTPDGPVITDFGVVGFLTPQEFEFNTYARRYLPYMAPELRQDWSNLVPQSDGYSLGAIAYEVLTGRPPGSPLVLPSRMSERFGQEADEFVLKAMAAEPSARFSSLEALIKALKDVEASLRHVPAPSTAEAPPPDEEEAELEMPADFLAALAEAEGEEDAAPATASRGRGESPAGEDSWRPSEPGGGRADHTLQMTSPAMTAEHGVAKPMSTSGESHPGPAAGEALGAQGITLPDYRSDYELPQGSFSPLFDPADGLGRRTGADLPGWMWATLALLGTVMVALSLFLGILSAR